MAKYQYFCITCQTEEEVSHPIAECDQTHPCMRCGAPDRKRIIGETPFILNSGGTGWHRDNYTRLGTSIKG